MKTAAEAEAKTDAETDAETTDRFATARAVADAVLYEGYVLYPYRASARKNQVRWQFGVLAPRAFSEADGSERWSVRTECVVDPGAAPALSVRLRFLQVQRRSVEAATARGFVPTDKLSVDGSVFVPWDEALEHAVDLPVISLLPLASVAAEHSFHFPEGQETEAICSGENVAGRVVRTRDPIEGRVLVTADWADGPGALLKVVVTVENSTAWSMPGMRRDDILTRALVAVHTMLAIDDGAFVSLLDPPEDAAEAVSGCVNDGTFPVLIGDADDVVLSSPIILYDHPEVAPESPGDLYDSTEIDEILALRVLTLTDEEKAEARSTDPRAAAIIDRCDNMPPELWERLHGAVRALHPTPAAAAPDPEPLPWWDPDVDASFDPWTDRLLISGVDVGKGTKVRLRPSRRSDAHDFLLAGLDATVAGVFRDVDGDAHLAVTIDSDPATEELEWQGRYLFFFPDEVELVSDAEAAQ